MFGTTQGEDTEAYAFDCLEDIGTRHQSGAGCADVINEQHMLTLDHTTVTQLKHICHILLTFPTVQLSLTLSEVLPPENLRNHWQMSNITDATRQLFTLIVAALTESFA